MRYATGAFIDGRYEVQAFLGEGGMAEVYRAVDSTSGQTVVVKLPHLASAGDLAVFNRYKREIEIGVHLDHPGVQRLLSDDSTPYMVLQYVQGDSLRAWISASRCGWPRVG